MIRVRLFVIIGGLVLASGVWASGPIEEDLGVRSSLALQQAMAIAREHLRVGESHKAVSALEAQLAKVNGHAGYLRLLRDAYRAHIKELWLANQGPAARRYLERLCILEPGADTDPGLRPAEKDRKKPAPVSPLASVAETIGLPNFAKNRSKLPTVRAQAEDQSTSDDPFALANQRPAPKEGDVKAAQTWLGQAELEFQKKRFGEARLLYEKAYQADRETLGKSKERWAYCLLDHVVEQLNQPTLSPGSLQGLEQQVKGALTMAPGLEKTARWLIGEIDKRQRPQMVAAEAAPAIDVQHLGRNPEGWSVTETSHFLIFHNQPREAVERIARIAENTRVEMSRKWFGSDGESWTPKCELILHPTAADYTRSTGVPNTSPGHTRIESDPSGQRVVGRRMDLRCDNPAMVDAVLPHETTHVVLAGQFGRHPVPRWADEGIAVLSEPRDKIDQHRRNLARVSQERGMFGLKELMELKDYPPPARIQAFYAQSVCLTEFLTRERGPVVFTSFVRDGLREGYDAALRRHYSADFGAMEQRWRQFVSSQRTGRD